MIGVINYQTGNAQSVLFALHHLGLEARLVAAPEEAQGVDRFILPGVGAADVTMASLRERGWTGHLQERVRGEGGLSWGCASACRCSSSTAGGGRPTAWGGSPARSWSSAGASCGYPTWAGTRSGARRPTRSPRRCRRPGTSTSSTSYYALPADEADVAGVTEYGTEFAAVVARGNVMATQFHIEKSGPVGLSLLSRFAGLSAGELRTQAVPAC